MAGKALWMSLACHRIDPRNPFDVNHLRVTRGAGQACQIVKEHSLRMIEVYSTWSLMSSIERVIRNVKELIELLAP